MGRLLIHVEGVTEETFVNELLARPLRDWGLVPFVVMHEFEGLLFSDCADFARGVGRPALGPEFQAVRDHFETPEHINDSVSTSPCRRVEGIVTGYERPLLGNLAALEIGLEKIQAACPHFNAWLVELMDRSTVIG